MMVKHWDWHLKIVFLCWQEEMYGQVEIVIVCSKGHVSYITRGQNTCSWFLIVINVNIYRRYIILMGTDFPMSMPFLQWILLRAMFFFSKKVVLLKLGFAKPVILGRQFKYVWMPAAWGHWSWFKNYLLSDGWCNHQLRFLFVHFSFYHSLYITS